MGLCILEPTSQGANTCLPVAIAKELSICWRIIRWLGFFWGGGVGQAFVSVSEIWQVQFFSKARGRDGVDPSCLLKHLWKGDLPFLLHKWGCSHGEAEGSVRFLEAVKWYLVGGAASVSSSHCSGISVPRHSIWAPWPRCLTSFSVSAQKVYLI